MARREVVADALLAAGLTALSLLLVGGLSLPWPAYALALLHTAAIAFRRAAPVAALAVALGAALAYLAVGYPMVGLGVAALVWAYTIGWLFVPPRSLVAFGVVQASVVATVLVGGQGDAGTLVSNLVALTVMYLLGDAARRRRDAQAEVARRAVAEERLRIARELHDVVAHSMSVIAVQAGTGRLVVDRDPAAARAALAVIERTSRDALDEMRRLLGVLRDPGDDGTGRTPAPGLDALDDLVARSAASGVPVSVRVEGERRPLPAGLELAAFRIVQEALTNVARHARGASATVLLAYRHGGLDVEVRNTRGWSGPADDGARVGLLGMRERAAVYGGEVDAAPTPDGGFRVAATLRGER